MSIIVARSSKIDPAAAAADAGMDSIPPAVIVIHRCGGAVPTPVLALQCRMIPLHTRIGVSIDDPLTAVTGSPHQAGAGFCDTPFGRLGRLWNHQGNLDRIRLFQGDAKRPVCLDRGHICPGRQRLHQSAPPFYRQGIHYHKRPVVGIPFFHFSDHRPLADFSGVVQSADHLAYLLRLSACPRRGLAGLRLRAQEHEEVRSLVVRGIFPDPPVNLTIQRRYRGCWAAKTKQEAQNTDKCRDPET